MFFDPQCKPEVKPATTPDIYALPTLIAWLETKPKDGTYNFYNCNGECLLGQYMTACGVKHQFGDGQYAELAEVTNWGTGIAFEQPNTFGAALERARALQS